MISIPVAVNIPFFKIQVDLWWWNLQKTYGDIASQKGVLLMVDKNYESETPLNKEWYKHIPHREVNGVWNSMVSGVSRNLSMPLNIQYGLKQIIYEFPDDQVLEINDCDLFHFKHHPEINIADDEMYVCDIYENWHIFSLNKNKFIIDIYFENGGQYYNGGFVPLIAKASVFKKIMYEWEAVHRDILIRKEVPDEAKWWAGMFALQAACEKKRIKMIAKDWCYLPPVIPIKEEHYTYHYSVDRVFNKKTYPNVDIQKFPDNICYNRIKEWMGIQN